MLRLTLSFSILSTLAVIREDRTSMLTYDKAAFGEMG
jgi:hypothetical protein